jgi:hypothetical protein
MHLNMSQLVVTANCTEVAEVLETICAEGPWMGALRRHRVGPRRRRARIGLQPCFPARAGRPAEAVVTVVTFCFPDWGGQQKQWRLLSHSASLVRV